MNTNNDLLYCKTRNVRSLERGTKLSAGIDFFVPELCKKTTKDIINHKKNIDKDILVSNGKIYIKPHQSVLVPSGIKTDILKSCDGLGLIDEINNVALIAFNKSGVATSKQLVVGACVVDSDYQGEIWIHVINTSDRTVTLNENDKIVQFLAIPILGLNPVEKEEKELFVADTERKDGGFGHTGN